MLNRFDLVAELNELGQELYGEQWMYVLAHNIQRLTASESQDIGSLDEQEIGKLIQSLRKLREFRRSW